MSDDDIDEATFRAGEYGSTLGTPRPDPHLPLSDTSYVEAAFKPTYIRPEFHPEHTSTTGIRFRENINFLPGGAYGRPFWNDCLRVRGLPTSTGGFWTATIVSAFQPEASDDADGIGEEATYGIGTHRNGATRSSLGSRYNNLCAVFVEVIRDNFLLPTFTAPHELAHLMGARHTTKGLMKEKDWKAEDADFLPESIDVLRVYRGP